MSDSSSRPDWAPPEGDPAFATRVVSGIADGAAKSAEAETRRGAPVLTVSELARLICAGDRAALARGITLVESRAAAHRPNAEALLVELGQTVRPTLRVGITGVPGAGKSTFIEALGIQLCAAGRRVAVLSVDPSSPVTGGSILGDKTRMERLSRHPQAFIRPSPSGGELGGVARRTRETITVCEAAGFDTVLIETVGVGQSEVVVHGMVDCFVVLMIAGAGDELQGIKKGILELADVLVVNKADGDNLVRAEAARLEFARALHYLMGAEDAWTTPVLACSARTEERIGDVWAAVEKFISRAQARGEFSQRRQAQALASLEKMVEDGWREALFGHAAGRAWQAEIASRVATGELTPAAGARTLLEKIRLAQNQF
jgi:LAO/AO transport system kinase